MAQTAKGSSIGAFWDSNKKLVYGAVAGFVVAWIVLPTWGGYYSGGGAAKLVVDATSNAKVAALAPICASRFEAQQDAPVKIASLAKESQWQRGTTVEKSGFATFMVKAPDGKEIKVTDSDVARACAEMLATLAPKS